MGEPLKKGYFHVSIEPNGVGMLEQEMIYPIRVVQPTAAEVKKFAGTGSKK